ncbi:hypothetical protein E4U21_004256 [Claviceps maximensis]|nr:hypothetical protein E4U21_004256 [Claviceps maximensis]
MRLLALLVPTLAAASTPLQPMGVYCNHGTTGDGSCEKYPEGYFTYCCQSYQVGEFQVPRLAYAISTNGKGGRDCGDGGKTYCCGS